MKLLIACLFFFFTLVVIASPGAHGPNGEHLDQSENTGSGGIGRRSDGSVVMPMKQQSLLGIRTLFAMESEATTSVALDGIIRPHTDGYAVVQSSSDGRLVASNEGLIVSGAFVKSGQILGYVNYQDSAYEYASQTSELLNVRNQIQQTKRDVARLENLGELSSRQSLEQLQTQLTSLMQTEAVLQNSLEEPEPLIAPISGILINRNVSVGQWVRSGETLFEIVSSDKKMVDAVTSKLELVQQLTTAYLHDRDDIKLNYIGYSPELTGGMITLHFETEQSSQSVPLLIGQPVELLAELNERFTGIVLPASAVVNDSSNLPVVWIKLSAEKFIPQQIKYQKISDNRIVVTSGLGSDNRVVIEGASLMNQIR